jgi:acyl carrier protein
MQDIRSAVRQFIIDNFLFGTGTVADGESLLASGIIDSTGVLELVGFLEAEYQISITDEELVPENLDSVDNVARFVTARIGLPQAAAALGGRATA